MIPVTKTYLPPIEEFTFHVNRAYNNGWLTNRGILVQDLESKLSEYLGLNESKILCLNNGTIPLQIAIKLLGKGGEIITTPFSYIATSSAIVWENCKPVYVDIDKDTLTIDESKIEAAITENTTCILATHVFGNPCNVEEIDLIAKKYNLKVIYDAAHCFGVKYKGKSIFEYGDISTCSFHATKIFHTGEGGAIFCKDEELYNKVYYSHNFGHNGPLEFFGLGINGKISELQAAMGLSVLSNFKDILKEREFIYNTYIDTLDFKRIKTIDIQPSTEWNFSYFPILLESEEIVLEIEKQLNIKGIYPRRYFYPSLNTISFLNKCEMLISEYKSQTVLCLPMYTGLNESNIKMICKIINTTLNDKG
jgi:dTDP-4-amino-4,6-dideoxygalactose transaminase